MKERVLMEPSLMRKLKFARQRGAAEETEATEALQWLAQQPTPPGHVADSVAAFRYLVAVARQHERCGLNLRGLVEVGYRAGLQGQDLWDWRVREGMVRAVELK